MGFQIEEGKFEEFKKLLDKMIEHSKANGVLFDEYYVSDDKTNWIHISRCEDSDKFMDILKNGPGALGDDVEAVHTRIKQTAFEIYGGPVGDDVKEMLAELAKSVPAVDYDIVYFPEEYGFFRR